jgi:hypothetical protein
MLPALPVVPAVPVVSGGSSEPLSTQAAVATSVERADREMA